MKDKLVGITHTNFTGNDGKAVNMTRFHVLSEYAADEQQEGQEGATVAVYVIMHDVQGLKLGLVDLQFTKIGNNIKLVGLKNI